MAPFSALEEFLADAVALDVIGLNLYPMFTRKRLLRDAMAAFVSACPMPGQTDHTARQALSRKLWRAADDLRNGIHGIGRETAKLARTVHRRRCRPPPGRCAARRLHVVADVRACGLGVSAGPATHQRPFRANGPVGPRCEIRSDSYATCRCLSGSRQRRIERCRSPEPAAGDRREGTAMFRSFFLAGFEGSTGYNRHGQWFDQVVATGHDKTVEQDYRDLAALGIRAARESVRWPLVDLRPWPYDFSSRRPFVARGAAHRHRGDLGSVPLRLPAGHRPLERRSSRALRRLLLRGGPLSSAHAHATRPICSRP